VAANNFTRRSQEALGAAIQLATSTGNPAVEPSHLLAALLTQTESIHAALITAAGADLPRIA